MSPPGFLHIFSRSRCVAGEAYHYCPYYGSSRFLVLVLLLTHDTSSRALQPPSTRPRIQDYKKKAAGKTLGSTTAKDTRSQVNAVMAWARRPLQHASSRANGQICIACPADCKGRGSPAPATYQTTDKTTPGHPSACPIHVPRSSSTQTVQSSGPKQA